ncbi:hypothetical protein D3C81_2122740 [compost metagenome]
MDALMTFDRNAFFTLAEAEQEGKKPFLTRSAVWQRDEHFGRVKRALEKSPKDYLGPNYDPDSPTVQKRRQASLALLDKAMQRAVQAGGEQ